MALSKINQRTVNQAKAFGDDSYYARTISAAHRAASRAQQKALEQVIAEHGTQHLFRMRNGAMVEA